MKSTKLTMIATAAMAFSLFTSAALSLPASAEVKTSADFTDLAGSDAALKAKIDAMIAAGIFEGVSDSTFGITQNMTRAQFAKVATLIYNITVDPTVKYPVSQMFMPMMQRMAGPSLILKQPKKQAS